MMKIPAVRGRVHIFMSNLMVAGCWDGREYLLASKQIWIIYISF